MKTYSLITGLLAVTLLLTGTAKTAFGDPGERDRKWPASPAMCGYMDKKIHGEMKELKSLPISIAFHLAQVARLLALKPSPEVNALIAAEYNAIASLRQRLAALPGIIEKHQEASDGALAIFKKYDITSHSGGDIKTGISRTRLEVGINKILLEALTDSGVSIDHAQSITERLQTSILSTIDSIPSNELYSEFYAIFHVLSYDPNIFDFKTAIVTLYEEGMSYIYSFVMGLFSDANGKP